VFVNEEILRGLKSTAPIDALQFLALAESWSGMIVCQMFFCQALLVFSGRGNTRSVSQLMMGRYIFA